MDFTNKTITVERDCEAILIPSGDPIKLIKGTHVRITQALGGDYTLFVNGNLVKITGTDADAIGMKQEKTEKLDVKYKPGDPVQEEQVWEQLRTVYDPEIPVNIVELGLIYDLNIKDGEKGKKIDIKMTLTAPGCGMGPVISDEVDRKINALEDVENVNVELVWEPQWNQGMMSEAAQLELGMF